MVQSWLLSQWAASDLLGRMSFCSLWRRNLRASECGRRGAFAFARYHARSGYEMSLLYRSLHCLHTYFPTVPVRSSPDIRYPRASSPHLLCLSSTNSLSRVQCLSSALTLDQSPKPLNLAIAPFSRPSCSRKKDGSQEYLGTPLLEPLSYSLQLFF